MKLDMGEIARQIDKELVMEYHKIKQERDELLAVCEEWLRIIEAVGGIRSAELMLNGLPSDAVYKVEEMTRLAIAHARGQEETT